MQKIIGVELKIAASPTLAYANVPWIMSEKRTNPEGRCTAYVKTLQSEEQLRVDQDNASRSLAR